MREKEIEEVAGELGIFPGKMISYSKSDYTRRFPVNLVIFNANIFMRLNHEFELVLSGCDLDLTKDSLKLILLAEIVEADIAVTYESDRNPDFSSNQLNEIGGRIEKRHKLFVDLRTANPDNYSLERPYPKIVGELAVQLTEIAEKMNDDFEEMYPSVEYIPDIKSSIHSVEYQLVSRLAFWLDPEWNDGSIIPDRFENLRYKISRKAHDKSKSLAAKALRRRKNL